MSLLPILMPKYLCGRVRSRRFSILCSRVCCQHKVDTDERQTHFGFQTVREDEKEHKVHHVFETVAESYDKMNDAMSFGIHRLWKDVFIQRLSPTLDTKLIDVAGGTGDISFRFLRYLQVIGQQKLTSQDLKSSQECDDDQKVTVCDINEAMLAVGKKRAEKLGYFNEINWVHGNAEKLPVESGKFDAYTIAFGIRNVTHIDKVLEDAHRVLRPGGRFMCLEFSQVNNALLRRMYDEYSMQVIPAMGVIIAGQWEPYQYLVESIRKFPNQDDFKCMIESAGFHHVTYENLSFGVVAIHSGFKL
ncbi:2-methoxy-6-polyprenyl-1,4-benzoquinol methylase, mitochondrial [Ischnura elegans]|uniref:2-methoxy-6-polyprenyl-1,4-benzoquinol methylase, mitochondrial n=1 Tax=Ischnura elegans TaxID=197161 RepID=UPI001ED8BCA2|nr:2-methoxy-6-polyprenyl-1,4-benzoquinol methylase, mitochondrial [Ischnura elegans]